MLKFVYLVALALSLTACGGGGDAAPPPSPAPSPPTAAQVWAEVDAAVEAAQTGFVNGLTVEVLKPAGVVYSKSVGGFSNTTTVAVASASKWVTASVLLRLTEQGLLSLDTPTAALLTDRQGRPWSGPLGQTRLRDLLSFTSGIVAEVPLSELPDITLEEAVLRIYSASAVSAVRPGTRFFYSSTHMRIAARMAEVATGKPWNEIFAEQVQQPLGWNSTSRYGPPGSQNPDPAGSLGCNGIEYVRFLMLQLREGQYGSTRLLQASTIAVQRQDAFTSATVIAFSPYVQSAGRAYHYGLGNWLETAAGTGPTPASPVTRWSSTGALGWAPWVAADGSYAAVIMTRQPTVGSSGPSEILKGQLDPLIRSALTQNPPVIRSVP